MNKRSYNPGHLKFLIVAFFMMLLADKFLFDGTRPYIEQARQEATTKTIEEYEALQEAKIKKSVQEVVHGKKGFKLAKLEEEEKPAKEDRRAAYGPADLLPWQKYAVPAEVPAGKPKVVIVIDDLGVNRGYSQDVIDLPGPLTLAFLPYAKHIRGMVKDGRKRGHEIIVHMPMEPMNGNLDTGDIVLKTGQSKEEFAAMLDKGLSAFEGFVGLNNHMGSRLTQDKHSMKALMVELKRRGYLFLDSRTIGSSVAGEIAEEFDVPYAVRDVFLDHDPSLEGVKASLAKVEAVAKEHGQAIAIGHPKKNTIEALQEWLPTLEEKGMTLVPVSAVVITKPSGVAEAGPSQSQARRHQ